MMQKMRPPSVWGEMFPNPGEGWGWGGRERERDTHTEDIKGEAIGQGVNWILIYLVSHI